VGCNDLFCSHHDFSIDLKKVSQDCSEPALLVARPNILLQCSMG
jgi:hypothetical protein